MTRWAVPLVILGAVMTAVGVVPVRAGAIVVCGGLLQIRELGRRRAGPLPA